MKLTAYTDERVFDELRPEWDDLLHRSTADMIFCTWEWQSTWWKAYQAGQLWVITCRDDDGTTGRHWLVVHPAHATASASCAPSAASM